RPAARSRRQEVKEEKRNQSRRGILHQIDEERFVVKDIETGRDMEIHSQQCMSCTKCKRISFA
ncbi:MAG: hypothetical protein J6B76_09260, partial [Peptococcaceae bacterium]|nr:hypothetical protein [Peptococcaceae bacterium]